MNRSRHHAKMNLSPFSSSFYRHGKHKKVSPQKWNISNHHSTNLNNLPFRLTSPSQFSAQAPISMTPLTCFWLSCHPRICHLPFDLPPPSRERQCVFINFGIHLHFSLHQFQFVWHRFVSNISEATPTVRQQGSTAVRIEDFEKTKETSELLAVKKHFYVCAS